MKKNNKGAEQSAPSKGFVQSFMYQGDNAASENKGIRFVLYGVLIAAGIMAKTMMDMKDEYRAMVIPSWTTESMQVTGTTANQFYLEEMAEYMSHLYGNLSPADARAKLDMLARLAHPTTFEAIKDKFIERVEGIEKLKTTTFHSRLAREKGIFVRKDFRNDYQGVDRATVQQLQFSVSRTAVIDGIAERPQLQHFSVDFVIERGRFYLLDYYEVKSHGH